MDRFVIREQRVGNAGYPQGNQMMAYPTITSGNAGNMVPKGVYYGGFGGEYQNMHSVRPPGFMGAGHTAHTHIMNAPQIPQAFAQTNTFATPEGMQMRCRPGIGLGTGFQVELPEHTVKCLATDLQLEGGSYLASQQGTRKCPTTMLWFPHDYFTSPLAQLLAGQGPVMSGIDPAYLSAYNNSAATAYVASGQQIQRESRPVPAERTFGTDYQNKNFIGPDKNKSLSSRSFNAGTIYSNEKPKDDFTSNYLTKETSKNTKGNLEPNRKFQPQTPNVFPHTKKPTDVELIKNEFENKNKSRADKLKALHKSGSRVFSAPVEKVLKWHKALQDLGVSVLYEIVGKCVSVRPGEKCAKSLVVRDENGPAMQVVYYEIDFLLPELKVPCMVRVIGRMMPGTCRLQAFSVRPASGDDVATLPRRAAVGAHHVAKLCRDYGKSDDKP